MTKPAAYAFANIAIDQHAITLAQQQLLWDKMTARERLANTSYMLYTAQKIKTQLRRKASKRK